jgi:hypothetical protein
VAKVRAPKGYETVGPWGSFENWYSTGWLVMHPKECAEFGGKWVDAVWAGACLYGDAIYARPRTARRIKSRPA